MSTQDIRWHQRFSNYAKALHQMEKFVERDRQTGLNDMEVQGMIKSFEYTYELAWNTLKDFYESQGEAGIQGSRDAINMAFSRGLIQNGTLWLEMVKARNRTAHTYNEATADEIATAVVQEYFPQFRQLHATLLQRLQGEQQALFPTDPPALP